MVASEKVKNRTILISANAVFANTNFQLLNASFAKFRPWPMSNVSKNYIKKWIVTKKRKCAESTERKNGSFGRKHRLCSGKRLLLIILNGIIILPAVRKNQNNRIQLCQKMIQILKLLKWILNRELRDAQRIELRLKIIN